MYAEKCATELSPICLIKASCDATFPCYLTQCLTLLECSVSAASDFIRDPHIRLHEWVCYQLFTNCSWCLSSYQLWSPV